MSKVEVGQHVCPGCDKKHPCEVMVLRHHKPIPFLGGVTAVHLVDCPIMGRSYTVGFAAGAAFFHRQAQEAHGLQRTKPRGGAQIPPSTPSVNYKGEEEEK